MTRTTFILVLAAAISVATGIAVVGCGTSAATNKVTIKGAAN